MTPKQQMVLNNSLSNILNAIPDATLHRQSMLDSQGNNTQRIIISYPVPKYEPPS